MNDAYFKEDPRPTDEYYSYQRSKSVEHRLGFSLFSVFDNVPIPYPKREFIVDEDSVDTGAGAHTIKTEPATIVKTEPASAMHSQQQQTLAHIKQQASHNNVPHAQQVSKGMESILST